MTELVGAPKGAPIGVLGLGGEGDHAVFLLARPDSARTRIWHLSDFSVDVDFSRSVQMHEYGDLLPSLAINSLPDMEEGVSFSQRRVGQIRGNFQAGQTALV